MPTEQEREFELVLGNRQLFSVLFVVIVLLAVFFAMGYVMGRNSSPADIAATRRSTENSSRDAGTDKPMQASSPVSANTAQSGPAERSYPAPVPATIESAAAPPRPKPIEVQPVSVSEPQPGTIYWQVSAVAKPEAELLVEVLTKKGFRAIVAPGPNQLFRVLVGPARDQNELSKLRGDLEQSGFKPMIRKY